MYLEFPYFRRCCCCLPLRHGIIVFGYVNLVIAMFIIAIEVIIMEKSGNSDPSKSVLTMFNGVAFVVQTWVAFVMYGIDIIFNVILLYGGHKKDTRMLRVYFYYGMATVFSTLILFIIMTLKQFDMEYGLLFQLLVTEASFTLTVLGIKIYLLLLIRSELKKLKENKIMRFTTNAFEDHGDLPFIDN